MTAATVFADVEPQYAEYRVRLQVRDLIVGGVPGDPSVIRRWLEARLDLGDKALEELAAETWLARMNEKNEPLSTEERLDAIMASDGAPSVNGFKRDADTGELIYEGRCMKAALKEFANSAYPGTEWPGKTAVAKGFRKGLMSTLAERVFVVEHMIGLGVKEPSRVEERIKHVMTPQGPKSAIAAVEVVERPLIEFTLRVHDDFLPREAWGRIWQRGEDIGIGADRGRSDGQFDLLAFDRT